MVILSLFLGFLYGCGSGDGSNYDGLDNDCDGSVDENLMRATTCGTGECSGNAGEETCTAGTWGGDTCDPFAGATAETCNDSLDNDCDGTTDIFDTDCEVGNFAIDFGQAPDNTGTVNAGQSMHSLAPGSEPGFTGEFTVEAWVKKNVDGAAISGVIFSRASDNEGIMLYFTGGNWITSELKFAMLKDRIDQPYVLRSGQVLAEGSWTHVAAVLVNEDHSAVHAECQNRMVDPAVDDTGASAQTPHIDMYINGTYADCVATECTLDLDPLNAILKVAPCPASGASGSGNFSDALTEDASLIEINEEIGHAQMQTGSFDSPSVWWATATWHSNATPFGFNTKTNAVIDEVRFWSTARTPAQINECKDGELSISGGGNCNVNHSELKGYWKFNEGQGIDVADHSGSGGSGTKRWCLTACGNASTVYEEWTGGWVGGAF